MPPQPARALRELQVERLDRFLRKARPDIAARIIARRLALKRRRPGDIGAHTSVIEKRLHLRADVRRRRRQHSRHSGHSQQPEAPRPTQKCTARAKVIGSRHQKSLPGLVLVSTKMRSMISSAAIRPVPIGIGSLGDGIEQQQAPVWLCRKPHALPLAAIDDIIGKDPVGSAVHRDGDHRQPVAVADRFEDRGSGFRRPRSTAHRSRRFRSAGRAGPSPAAGRGGGCRARRAYRRSRTGRCSV